MSNEQNGELPISWPVPQVQTPPYFGTTPPPWTGATMADATAAAASASAVVTAPPAQLQAVQGVAQQLEKSAEQLVAEGKADAAAKKAKKLAEAVLRQKWATPWDRFNAWQAEFQFTIDAMADETNHKVPRWIGPNSSVGVFDASLVQMLPGERVWINPAGFDESYVKKCWEWMGQPAAQRPQLIVQLRPANQTEQPFWQEYVEQFRDWNGYQQLQPVGIDFRVRFLTPRVEFVPPAPEVINGVRVEIKESSPRSGHCLLIWRNLLAPAAPVVTNG